MARAALERLRKEYQRLQKAPPDHIEAAPLESNLLEWHYVLHGPPHSPYQGGVYHGKLVFPREVRTCTH
jgi:ubiquitin-conjugating enzyme E2 J2